MRSKVRASAFLLFVCASALACAEPQEPAEAQAGDGGAALVWSTLHQGTQCAVETAGQSLIGTPEELRQAWQQTFAGVDPAPALPALDFATHQVVAAYLGETRSAGHAIEIQGVARQPDGAVVTLRHSKPGAGCMSAAVIEYPYLFAKIERLGAGPVRFEVVTTETSCE